MPSSTTHPSRHIAILGAGPIGIEAALHAQHLGHNITLYDKGAPAQNLLDWGHIHLFSPWSMNITALGLGTLCDNNLWGHFPVEVCPTGHELRDHYLLPLLAHTIPPAHMRTHTRILKISRDDFHKSDAIGKPARASSPFRILVEDADGHQRIDHADIVLDCTGTYGNARPAGRGGIPAPGESSADILRTLPDVHGRDRNRFINQHTLLIGGGYSAATFLKEIELLQRSHGQTRVTWAIRQPALSMHLIDADPLPARRNLVEACLNLAHNPPAWLTFTPHSSIESIEKVDHHLNVTLNSPDSPAPRIISCDQILSLTGYTPDLSIYDQLQIHTCYATHGPIKLAAALLGQSSGDCLSVGADLTADTLKNPEPGFFILGAKSYGTNSNFLLRVGHQQIVDVMGMIGK